MSRRMLLLFLAALLVAAIQATPLLGAAVVPPGPPARPGDLGTGWSEPEPLAGAIQAPPERSAGTQAALTDWWTIVYQSYRNNNWEIYLTDGSGAYHTRLTDDPANDIHPRLNRGCTRIAFASKRGGDYEIWTMNLDGSDLTRVTDHGADDVMPAWSYDGSRIAFQSYRDGQAEVYVMNADGSNRVRLTANDAYDGEPSWSPDGSQIAFTSNRSGAYSIWTMNADGSNPVLRSNQASSENPAWAPSGLWIAYDADLGGDGFQELMRMGPAGTGHTQLYNPTGAYTDALARSWTPDGMYAGFSQISWVYYQGQWYWISGYLYAVDQEGSSLTLLSTSGLDWSPDVQSPDLVPPSSGVAALPATSPAPIPVHWSGSDPDGSGISSYDVQVRDGEGGAWSDWLIRTPEASGAYPAAAGHTYYFRSRAWDRGGNGEAWQEGYDAYTTVETLPPETAVDPLPELSPYHLPLTWGGTDPGGSGVATYDVQFAMSPGGYSDWLSDTPDTSGVLGVLPGETYYFRSRGRDRAGNLEEWPAGPGDAWTTAYSSRLSGTVRDHTGTPVGGASVTVVPEPLASYPSGRDGAYSAYIALLEGTYSAAWEKTGYGDLPPASFGAMADAPFNVVLPPADNGVVDWGFESGDLLPAWLPGGSHPPAVSGDARHTGAFGAALGRPITWAPAETVSSHSYNRHLPVLAVDAQDTVHILWSPPNERVYLYRQRRPDGTWSAVETVSSTDYIPEQGRLAVDPAGTPHVVWVDGPGFSDDIFYSSRSNGGIWSTPLNLSNDADRIGVPNTAFTADGVLNVAWAVNEATVRLVQRHPDGTWTDPTAIPGQSGATRWNMAPGGDGSLHVVWYKSTTGIGHARRDASGSWSGVAAVAPAGTLLDDLNVAVDGSGTAHVTWVDFGASPILHRQRSQAGDWSGTATISGDMVVNGTSLAVSQQGTAHSVWRDPAVLYHAWLQADGSWTEPALVSDEVSWLLRPQIAIEPGGAVRLVWVDYYGVWTARWQDGDWSETEAVYQPEPGQQMLSEAVHTLGPQLRTHIVCATQLAGHEDSDLHYIATGLVRQPEDSVLEQAVVVPAGGQPWLSFLYRLNKAWPEGPAGLRVTLDNGSGPVELLAAADRTPDWTHASLNLVPWAGQPVTLSLTLSQEAGRLPVELALDEVTLGNAYPDVWVTKSALPIVPPGGLAAFTLAYGNTGGAPAYGVVLTDTLPAGLAFVSAEPPPATTQPFLTWQVGDLQARAGTFTVALRALASPDLPQGTTLTNEVTIGSASLELEALNNVAHAKVLIGHAIFLPMALKGK